MGAIRSLPAPETPIPPLETESRRPLGFQATPDFDPITLITRSIPMSKCTFQPNNRRRAKVHGFRIRMRTRAGRAIVSARRGKGRSKLTA